MRPTAFINALKLDQLWTSDGKSVYRNSMNLSHKYLARGAPLWRSVGASQIRPLSSGGIPRL